MVCKKYYCSICDKYVSNKGSHNKTKNHNTLSLSVVDRYHIKNVHVEEEDDIINQHIHDYNKKFISFLGWFKIQNESFCHNIKLGWMDGCTIKTGEQI